MSLNRYEFALVDTRIDMTYQRIKALSVVLNRYQEDFGKLPSSREGLHVLIRKNSKGRYPDNKWILYDAWGNEIVYRSLDNHKITSFRLYSMGQNGVDEFGQGDDVE